MQSGTLRAEYDADSHVLYVYLPNHPYTDACVKHTADHSTGVLYDIGHDDTVIGIEVLLSEPLRVFSGDNGKTRTVGGIFVGVGPDPTPAPPADDLDACPACYCDPCQCRPIIGNCSKCGDVREDEYTCRDGGHTVLKEPTDG